MLEEYLRIKSERTAEAPELSTMLKEFRALVAIWSLRSPTFLAHEFYIEGPRAAHIRDRIWEFIISEFPLVWSGAGASAVASNHPTDKDVPPSDFWYDAA
ncbi:jg15240 [Pararge aegeria aegeria]|uniref:Jg15240 protein n=1 Tax=Pararge aegeria aegeria TaxID=348720 RepID=A0A8S4RGJ7_9NEOP|nr:jg15240 [Pararge aegeria aegeria]